MASVTPLQALLFHEVWICLQHGNVLFNPLCQRLDRNYGISLFKNDMVWVIAFTLSAYWLREIVSMALCYRMSTQFTQKLILVSCGYHAFKIINVNIDAWRKWSPKLGILRLLLDYWHFDTVVNCIISFKRMFLQGFDTAVHGCIIFDFVNSSHDLPFPDQINISEVISPIPYSRAVVIFAATIWFCHALAVQISRKSTATIMVEMYRNIAIFFGFIDRKVESLLLLPTVKESTNRHTSDKMKGNSIELFLGPHIYASHKSSSDCQVCRMLSKPTINATKINSKEFPLSSDFNDTPSIVFLAHPMQVASAFSLWSDEGKNDDSYWKASWWMETSIMSFFAFFMSIIFYPVGVIWFNCSPVVIVDKSAIQFKSENDDKNMKTGQYKNNEKDKFLKKAYLFDKLTFSSTSATFSTEFESAESLTKSEVWLTKSFGWQFISKINFWRGYAKEMVVRSVLKAEKEGVKVIGLGALNKAHWLNNGGEDVVKEIKRRRLLNAEKNVLPPNDVASILESGQCGECSPSGIKVVHGNTLTAAVVCSYLKSILKHDQKDQCKNDVNMSVPSTSFILIGATSKIGRAVVLKMASVKGISIFCVGANSQRMKQIIQDGRQAAFDSLGEGSENRIFYCKDALTASESAPNSVWVLGKGDRSTGLVDIIPFRARVLSFAVPCPLVNFDQKSIGKNMMEYFEYFRGSTKTEKEMKGTDIDCGRLLIRTDIRYIDAGVLVIPKDMKEKRQYSLLLPRRLVYACHAAALIHYLESWNYHEVGEVILENMDITLKAAQKHGFSVDSLPQSFLIDSSTNINNDSNGKRSDNLDTSVEGVDVVIIGCGPSGLAVAGSLMLNNIINNNDHIDSNTVSQNRNKNQIIENVESESWREGQRKIKGVNMGINVVTETETETDAVTMRMIDGHQNIEGQVRSPILQ